MTLDRAFLIALVVAGAAGGVVLAVGGAFFIPLARGPFSVGDLVALAVVGPFCHAVGLAARSTWVGALPGVTWLMTTSALAIERPEGDLVVTGQPFHLAFLLLGTVSAAFGIGTIPAGLARDVRPNGSSEEQNGR